jgi:hypothetical protein
MISMHVCVVVSNPVCVCVSKSPRLSLTRARTVPTTHTTLTPQTDTKEAHTMKLSLAFSAGLLVAAATACAAFQLPLSMSAQQQQQPPQSRRGAAVDRRSHAWGGAAVLAGAGAVLAGSPLKPVRADVPEEGIDAPDFTLASSLGKPLSLAELRKSGKYTVLYFFPQVRCVSWGGLVRGEVGGWGVVSPSGLIVFRLSTLPSRTHRPTPTSTISHAPPPHAITRSSPAVSGRDVLHLKRWLALPNQ